jgi:hypothetical protein
MKSIAEEIEASVLAVTKDWAKQRKREERQASAVGQRRMRLVRFRQSLSLKDAASEVMEKAYLKASDGRKLPTKPRQIMYAARPELLAMTDKDVLNDVYFTQQLLPDYIEAHPNCAQWDIVWDARGTFNEPHTGIEVPLGTLEVRQYLGLRAKTGSIDRIEFSDRFATNGPEQRYNTVLFVEKEGFEPLMRAASLAERFDVAIMSTKGMSTTAARLLLERLSARGVRQILVLHDFDVSGFSIFGTLGTDTRRYQFTNDIPIVDIGLRLDDVEEMDLQSEPVATSGDWRKRAATLRRHGATDKEIEFLCDQRVELNAMTSRQIIDFIEAKFDDHGIIKLIPDDEVIERHARHMIERQLVEKAITQISIKIAEEARTAALPTDLRERIERALKEHPQLSWDAAVARIIRNAAAQGSAP